MRRSHQRLAVVVAPSAVTAAVGAGAAPAHPAAGTVRDANVAGAPHVDTGHLDR